MNTTDKRIVVTGVTGRQGGATARHLLGKGFKVRGLTRRPDSPEARRLVSRGVEIVEGNLDTPSTLLEAFRGCYGVFSIQSFMEAGVEGEVRQGIAVADAAKTAGIKHLVYTSVASANRKTGLPHFDSKYRIEEHIRAIGIPYSILRPVFFAQNWAVFCGEEILRGTLRQPLAPETSLQQISVDDIGAFAAMAFTNPERWIGRECDLAGDELTMTELARTFTRVLGREVRYVQVSSDDYRRVAGEEFAAMYRWFQETGYDVDIEALRKEYPQLARVEDVLWAEDWRHKVSEERKAA